MIIAHGIDIVDIVHTARLLADPTDQFLTRCFTAQEQNAVGTGTERAARFSGRLAAKEAVMKALGTGFSAGVGFLSIEIVTLPSGAPTIVLHGEARKHAELLGIVSWLVSTSHEGDMAIASVIGLADQSAPR
ncbi:holo-ACP synthase [Sphingobium fuliginis]|uniref:Holo-[acyl-carrier-protein] synthase n=1 Tax=Sphingobium fuliginis (strain ATCC 27551) TaxID=336203 RepID=A0A292ZC75_SPHSA|nr:holo-ACP synthase [Sphingobium fuliginis]GAY20385.1 holo-[acyl-carrier protein] synthase [Sphingobium fuliginis]